MLHAFLETVVAALPLSQLAASLRHAILISGALFVVVFCLESLGKADRSRYLTRNFLIDVGYALFYQGGIYNVLFYVPLYSTLAPDLSIFEGGIFGLLPLPTPVAYVGYWLVVDFMGYGFHRLQHTNRFLWAFHSVHHTQTRLTFLTSYRNHVLDQLIANTVLAVPLALIGVPPAVWLPFFLLQQFNEAIQHSELDWRYGRLYRFLVSPVFHGLHHSTEPAQYNGNYGKILAIWDYAFTSSVEGERPKSYGVTGLDVPETITGQLLAPLRVLRGADRVVQPA
jgi:sterol desaturase/sphingolipid hydroxylase (fatty acid hydroxylase superfamily)